MTRKIPWARLLVESGLIVLSILLAFGIEAGWSSRQDRAREEATVAGLARDFQVYREVLQLNIERYERRLQATERLLEATGPSAASASVSDVRDLGMIGFAGPVRFQGGTLETLLSTDGLSLLRSDSLRVSLTAWTQYREDLDGVNDFVVGEADVLLDYLRTRQSLQDIDRAAAMSDLPASGFPLDLDFRSLEFANTVYQQRYATIVLLSYLRLLDDVALQVLAQVEEG